MEETEIDISSMTSMIPQKLKGKKKKSGGFQSMNLSYPILKAILRKGYQIPTPIQRKAIPIALQGKNVMAMARTGSGKTAAFLIPMLQLLKSRVPKRGARALIFSPTRELAMQTMKFTKELSCNTDLKSILILGGEKIENQFAAIHESPDIIIATPGRFLHVIVEMDLKLSSVQYVVFDEADRLFEMGFQEQLQECLLKLPSERQTLLFSATLPKVLVEFVNAGIDDPVLIRLNVDLQISENLQSSFLMCRGDDKTSVLLYLLKHVINLRKQLTVVFIQTKHHVEYLRDVLEKANIPCSYIYSSLDQVARTINIAKFRARKVGVMLVTDIAARGIDIPLLDNVINYNFPAKPKLYVHRVGRVARAGRSGKAFSLVAPDEIPYMIDLHLFLGNPLIIANKNSQEGDGICGCVPQNIIDDEQDMLHYWNNQYIELSSMLKVISNAQKKFVKTRPPASSESVRRMKSLTFSQDCCHPMFKDVVESERNKLITEMKSFRPNTTIFELGFLAKTSANAVMRQKRLAHGKFIKSKPDFSSEKNYTSEQYTNKLAAADENDLKHFLEPSKMAKKVKTNYKDEKHYLSYVSSDHYTDKGLGLESSFLNQASGAQLDLTCDEVDIGSKHLRHATFWDRKKKKFKHTENPNSMKMKTESGVWIPKTYKTDVYKKWQEKNKVRYQEPALDDSKDKDQFGKRNIPHNVKKSKGKVPRRRKQEIKSKEQILKTRKRKQKILDHDHKAYRKRLERRQKKK